MAKMGRPSALTDKVRRTILTYLRAGNYLADAYRAAGVGRSTFFDWMRLGAAGDEPFASFREECEQAVAQWQVNAVAAMNAAGNVDWRAHAHMLERRAPAQWGAKARDIQERIVTHVLSCARRVLAPEAFDELVAALAADEMPSLGEEPELSTTGALDS